MSRACSPKKRHSAKTRRLSYAPLKSRLSAYLLAPVSGLLDTHYSSAYPALHKGRLVHFHDSQQNKSLPRLLSPHRRRRSISRCHSQHSDGAALLANYQSNATDHASIAIDAHTHTLPGWRNGVFVPTHHRLLDDSGGACLGPL